MHEFVTCMNRNVAHHLYLQVDIGEVAFATMLNLVSNTVFSVDLVDPEFETAGEFKELVWRIMEDAGKLNLSDYFPALKWFDLQGVRRHVMSSYQRLHEIFDDLIQKRLKQRQQDSYPPNGDFLDVLLDQCPQEDESDFTVESIKPLILVNSRYSKILVIINLGSMNKYMQQNN